MAVVLWQQKLTLLEISTLLGCVKNTAAKHCVLRKKSQAVSIV
jgi:hypothetical protein